MTAQEFLDWMTAAHCRTAADVIRVLGCSRRVAEGLVSAARPGDEVEVKLTFALAMAAAAHGIAPWPNRKGD